MPVSDLKLLTEFCHHVVVEISGIIRDDGFRETKSAYQNVFDKSCDNLFRNSCIGFRLDPFREVIDSHQYETVIVGRFRSDRADDVHSPHR